MSYNTKKITREFCKGKILIFHPKDEKEAKEIQRRVFAMGYAWCNEHGVKVMALDQCVEKGMVLQDCVLYTQPSEENRKKGLVCHVSQFDAAPSLPSAVTPQEQESLQEQFNDLSGRMKNMEKDMATMLQMLADVHREVMPRKLEKPGANL